MSENIFLFYLFSFCRRTVSGLLKCVDIVYVQWQRGNCGFLCVDVHKQWTFISSLGAAHKEEDDVTGRQHDVTRVSSTPPTSPLKIKHQLLISFAGADFISQTVTGDSESVVALRLLKFCVLMC